MLTQLHPLCTQVHMLHTHGELQGCTEVVKGVYLGGIAVSGWRGREAGRARC
jgi:hypothetical protein